MAQCVTFIAVDGVTVVAPDTAASDVCASGYLLVASSEAQALVNSPFNLSLEDGAVISVAIGGCMALAYAFRQIAQVVSGGVSTED